MTSVRKNKPQAQTLVRKGRKQIKSVLGEIFVIVCYCGIQGRNDPAAKLNCIRLQTCSYYRPLLLR